MDLLIQGISLFLLIALAFVFCQGFKKNQAFLSEREDLLKRYLLFRGDRQVRLKIYEGDEKIYQELLKNISSSWKNFKKVYDQCLLSFSQNTLKTKFWLQIITLCLLLNSAFLIVRMYATMGFKSNFFYTVVRELSSYVLVILSFVIFRMQTHRFLSLKGEVGRMERDILFYPNHLSTEAERDVLYEEFDPLEPKGGKDGEKNPDPG
ncbi:MAG: hypothetical protein ACUVWO_15050 [Thermodesulfobacteriota bacterium]